jgi:alpha-tubulin suppressor-like RCC1 family protein
MEIMVVIFLVVLLQIEINPCSFINVIKNVSAQQQKIVDISTGFSHTCARLNDGTSKCWGRNDFGQLGIGNNKNQGRGQNDMGQNLASVNLGLVNSALFVNCGGQHCCVLLKTGRMKCFGDNNYGQLGLLEYSNNTNWGDAPNEVGNGLPYVMLTSNNEQQISSISSGGAHTCAILEHGILKCFGNNNHGQAGLESSSTELQGEKPMKEMDYYPFVSLGTNVKVNAVSAGISHTCVILVDNNTSLLKCFGNNENGQTGLGFLTNRTKVDVISNDMGNFLPPVNLGTGRYATDICTGEYHTCVLLDDATVKCFGQFIGNDEKTQIMMMSNNMPPLLFDTNDLAISIACKYGHTCVVFNSTKLKCFGSNRFGQLGLGHRFDVGFDNVGFNLPYINVGFGVSVKQVATGGDHTCVILGSNDVKCFGRNENGQLGLGHRATIGGGDSLTEMGDFLPVVSLGAQKKAIAISMSKFSTCVVLDSGNVKCFGYNGFGQLGVGDVDDRGSFPNTMGDSLAVVGLFDIKSPSLISSIEAGQVHTCAILDKGVCVKCFGSNIAGYLGVPLIPYLGRRPNEIGSFIPCVDIGEKVIPRFLSVGESHTCVITGEDYQLKCWGNNLSGQLGLGHTDNPALSVNRMGDSLPFVNVGKGRKVIAVGIGNLFTCVLLDNASVKCFGDNISGQLGQGHSNTIGTNIAEMGEALPTVLLSEDGRNVISIGVGRSHACVVLDNGNTKCWGSNSDGQLGYGDKLNRGDEPNEMGKFLPTIDLGKNLTGSIAVSCGGSHTCVILNNTRQIKCFGRNSEGQLGIGEASSNRGLTGTDMGDNLHTVALGIGRYATTIALGNSHTCVLLDDFTMKCFGYNNYGQLGVGKDVVTIGLKEPEITNLRAVYVIGTGFPTHAPSRTPSHSPKWVAPSANPHSVVPTASPRNSSSLVQQFTSTADTVVIVGGIIGGVLGIFLIVGCSFLLWKKYKDREEAFKKQPFLDKTLSTIAFLSHDWGQDLEHTNHKRVSKIYSKLKQLGIETWIDEERLKGEVVLQITAAIDKTKVIVVFITKRYINKVNQKSGDLDYCQMEFGYALRTKKVTNMIPVVMEAEMLDTSKWFGPVGAALGGQLYIDMSSEDNFDQGIKLLHQRICDLAGISLPSTIGFEFNHPQSSTRNNVITQQQQSLPEGVSAQDLTVV